MVINQCLIAVTEVKLEVRLCLALILESLMHFLLFLKSRFLLLAQVKLTEGLHLVN